MANVPLALWAALFVAAVFAPLRWSFAAYLVLSVVDFYSGESAVGALNTLRGLVFPLFLLWRLRAQSGHSKVMLAPFAFLIFAAYVALGSVWSIFPLSAWKLVVQLVGSFLIAIAFLRGAKGGYLTPSIVLPVTAGVLAVGILRTFFSHNELEPDRFTGYISAQAYASFCTALFCVALSSKTIRPAIRCVLCALLATAVVLDGSRIWIFGLSIAILMTLLTSRTRSWIKIYSASAIVLAIAAVMASSDLVLKLLEKDANSNRVASFILDVYQGDTQGRGLGTYNLRRRINDRGIEMMEASSVQEVLFGHGTSNGAMITWSVISAGTDPNRAVHNEWLRILYEWGIAGMLAWIVFICSITAYAIEGVRRDTTGHSQPLVAYLPAFLLGVSGENVLAGAGSAVNLGFILVIALASISHRESQRYIFRSVLPARRYAAAAARGWRMRFPYPSAHRSR